MSLNLPDYQNSGPHRNGNFCQESHARRRKRHQPTWGFISQKEISSHSSNSSLGPLYKARLKPLARMGWWWMGPHFDQDCLVVPILVVCFNFILISRSRRWTWKSHSLLSHPRVTTLINLLLFCFTSSILSFNWLIEDSWYNMAWGTGCDLQVQ